MPAQGTGIGLQMSAKTVYEVGDLVGVSVRCAR
jgi:hypothetical protein